MKQHFQDQIFSFKGYETQITKKEIYKKRLKDRALFLVCTYREHERGVEDGTVRANETGEFAAIQLLIS